MILLAVLLAAPAAVPAQAVPRDVRRFVDRRAMCDHWSGEEPYDQARNAQILAALTRLRCETIDADEAKLRRRYAQDPAALRALDPVEEP
ncbi:hypothetical protein ACBY01_04125 [Sphingomonas sp. ac-8]|uniref:hypothetical protein n=1 Tax=Sphingomonas sp. ac-8 TaxID=3242977 RepID=UPI003A803FDB